MQFLSLKIFPVIFVLFTLIACTPEEIDDSELVERGGISYKVNSDTPFTGRVVKYRYTTYELWSRRNFKDGKLHGLTEVFSVYGQLSRKVLFENGVKHGLFEFFHKNGQLSRKGRFEKGVEHGLFEFFHENGQLSRKGRFEKGEQIGLWESFTEDGRLRDEINFSDLSLPD